MGKHRSNDLKQAVVDFYNRMKNKSIENLEKPRKKIMRQPKKKYKEKAE